MLYFPLKYKETPIFSQLIQFFFTFKKSTRVNSLIFMYNLGQESASGTLAERKENMLNYSAALFI